MINTDPSYIFKGSLAGLYLFFMSFAIIAWALPALGFPFMLLALGLLIFRFRCAYWEQRFSNYAILIILLQLLLSPLLASALISIHFREKIGHMELLLATLLPLASTLGFIAVYGRLRPPAKSPFRILNDRVFVEPVGRVYSKKWALAGGGAALFGSYVAGKENAQLIMALIGWLIGFYMVFYYHSTIHGLRDLRNIERQEGRHFKFHNHEALDEWRARTINVRILMAVRNKLFKGGDL